jgi:hypothetical protein
MMRGRKTLACGAIGAAFVCLLGVGTMRAQGGGQGGAQDAAGLTTDKLFRNIQVLKGMPIDTFFDAMGMFAASMGDDCTYCHSKDAVFRHEAFGDATPRIQKARQMIVMMQALNKQYFGGQPRVTCFTCHRGNYRPDAVPDLALQYGELIENPNAMEIIPSRTGTVDQVFDKYLAALGGAQRVGHLGQLAAGQVGEHQIVHVHGDHPALLEVRGADLQWGRVVPLDRALPVGQRQRGAWADRDRALPGRLQ